MKALLIVSAIVLTASAAQAEAPRLLRQEPGPGQLRPDETVLVDDGSCPAGQIKQVTGGSNRDSGTDISRPGAPRVKVCVQR